jgi:hypothetical protein
MTRMLVSPVLDFELVLVLVLVVVDAVDVVAFVMLLVFLVLGYGFTTIFFRECLVRYSC